MTAFTDVVAALIVRGDKFLICKRPAHKARGGLWEFAGGKTEPGETKEEALVRECREELGVFLTVGEVFAEVKHVYPDLKVRLTVFRAETADEPKRIEHEELRFITPAEIPLYEFCPADRPILEKLQREL